MLSLHNFQTLVGIMDLHYLLTTPGRNKVLQSAAVTVAGSQTGSTLVAAVAGKSIYAYYIKMVATAATTIKLLSNTTAFNGPESYPTQGGYIDSLPPPDYVHKTASGEALKITTGPGAVEGFVKYWVE